LFRRSYFEEPKRKKNRHGRDFIRNKQSTTQWEMNKKKKRDFLGEVKK